MMETTRFGQLTIAETKIITVVGGLLGFPGYTRFVVLHHEEAMEVPFRWLQSVENPDLAFVIIDPWGFKPDYAIELPDEVCSSLHLSAERPPLIFAIVTAPLEPTLMSANLQGPLIINPASRQAQQAVLTDSPYTTRHLILPELLRTGNQDHVASSVAHYSAV